MKHENRRLERGKRSVRGRRGMGRRVREGRKGECNMGLKLAQWVKALAALDMGQFPALMQQLETDCNSSPRDLMLSTGFCGDQG